MKLLLQLIAKGTAESLVIPTRLFARASIIRDSLLEAGTSMNFLKPKEFDMLFDEVFYRYQPNENEINFKRCFFVIMLRISKALNERYIDDMDYAELCRLVNIFISNGALQYTDMEIFLTYLRKLKDNINYICEGFRYRIRMQELCDYIDECVIRYLNSVSKQNHAEQMRRKGKIKQFVERSIRFKHGTDKELLFIFRNMHLFGATDGFVYVLATCLFFIPEYNSNLIFDTCNFPDTMV